jgi:PKD repeat protein
LVVANAQDANINANGELISVAINPESSQGPTDDYRIKPDITGNGTAVYSTYQNADNQYGTTSGTSMATPNVTGTLMLLQEHYHNLNGQYMLAASLKGLALHTADDAGVTGPDAIWGWGLINGKKAANAISNNGDESRITELNLNNGNNYSVSVKSDGVNDLVASISWTDPPGTINTGTANDNTPVLVNDLDIRVSNGTTYLPYKLITVTTNSTGDNVVDPYEKIVINGASGNYTITVTHKGSLTGGSQNFTLIVTGEEGVPAAPVANFYADETNPETGQTVSFSDVSLKAPTSWAWTFSPSTVTYVDGTSSTSQNPKVTFDAVDTYTATLVATNGLGSDTEVKVDYIIAADPICSYCASTYANTSDDWISKVTFNSIDNSSGQGGSDSYEDFTSISTNIVQDSTYPLTVSLQINDNSTEYVWVWVDWNQDCDFDDSGEVFNLGSRNSTGTVTANIAVPTDAILGLTTIRIMEQYNNDHKPCNPHLDVYGETEDYGLNVVSCRMVSNLNDSGEGSLRDAIDCAEDGDTVFFSSSINESTIIITSSPLVIDNNITIIDNPGSNNIVSSIIPQISQIETVFNINAGKIVEFKNFSIKGGYGPNGSAIRNQGNLLLDNIKILNGGMSGLNSVVENQTGAVLKIENNTDID